MSSTDSKKFQRLFDHAVQLAMNQSTMIQQHAALMIEHGRIVSQGHNYAERCMFKKHIVPGFHAEIECLRRMPKNHGRKLDMIVVRAGTPCGGCTYKTSKPCSICIRHLYDHGVRRVYYFFDGEWMMSKVSDLYFSPDKYYSVGTRLMGIENYN
jgi:tRNA(Arg) A34 adenosine deaminase TadA